MFHSNATSRWTVLDPKFRFPCVDPSFAAWLEKVKAENKARIYLNYMISKSFLSFTTRIHSSLLRSFL